MTNPAEDKGRSEAQTSMQDWPICAQLPTNPGVRLIFAGLMGLCYNPRTRFAEIGFYKSPRHTPEVIVYEQPGQCQSNKLTPGPRRMRVGIASQSPNVCFYNRGGSFGRYSANESDMRWMIDLNAHDWYPGVTEIPPGYFAPVLEVSHGSFFTLQKTKSTFKRIEKSDLTNPVPFGYMSRFFAADIEVPNGQTVTLNTGSISTVLRPTQQRSYEVLFTNLCMSAGSSDFHLLVETIASASTGDIVYDFVLEYPGNEAKPHFCIKDSALEGERASDDAPCMGAGFGGAGGFPGP